MEAYKQVKVIGRGAFGAAILCYRVDDKGPKRKDLIMKEVRHWALDCPQFVLRPANRHQHCFGGACGRVPPRTDAMRLCTCPPARFAALKLCP